MLGDVDGGRGARRRAGSTRVWIDLANSPHPLLFAPIARALEAAGHAVLVTVRDHAQTLELAREHWPDPVVIGGESPPGRLRKGGALVRRIRLLRSWARERRPDVAVSHNSYAQIVAAKSVGVPSVTAMDYEHQPANHLAFRLARLVLLPEAYPVATATRQGATKRKTRRYPGLKEALYIGDFEPDQDVTSKLGIDRHAGESLVVVRTPPTGALYHGFENALHTRILETISAKPDVRCVVLARNASQAAALKTVRRDAFSVPEHAIDSRSLLYAADLVIGAGGTMTREAALMGVPTFSVFAGRQPAVDRWLERSGRLSRVTDARQVASVTPRDVDPPPIAELRQLAAGPMRVFLDAVADAARGLG